MQQKDQENAPSPKKHWRQLDFGGVKDNSSPSVVARSAAFKTKAAQQVRLPIEWCLSKSEIDFSIQLYDRQYPIQ